MKKTLLTTSGIAMAFASFGQLPASTSPQNRKVVLEEFTGIYCQFCPDGHKLANQLKAAKPAGSVILANIHTGGYAAPSGPNDPDFRTAEGTAISNITGMNISGYPTGSINRKTFFGKTAMALNRGEWNKYADSILATPSYVNIALEGSLNVSTRTLTVQVQAYYTGNSPVSTNNLSVVLLEDGVLGPQVGANAWYPAMINEDGSYTHNHLLRKVLTTAATGEVITTTTSGTTVNKTYTYQIPAQYVNNAPVLGNFQLAGFIAESNSDIVTAAYGPITLTGFDYAKDAHLQSATAEAAVCAGVLNPKVKIYNNGSSTIASAVIEYKVNGGTVSTYNFTGTINPATYKNVTLPAITFTPTAMNDLTVNITTVNGSADENATNSTTTINDVPLTTAMASNQSMTMNFTQDRYGSESSWKVFEDGTTTVVAQDGPFTDLAANGVQLNTKTFNINPSKCYKLEVYDSYGDGINAGAGAGKYELLSGTAVIASSNGNYGKGDVKWYKAESVLGLNDLINIESVSVYPNPTFGNFTVAFSLVKSSKVDIVIVDMMGRNVQTITKQNRVQGNNKIELSTTGLATGVYNVKIQTEEGSVNHRLTVTK